MKRSVGFFVALALVAVAAAVIYSPLAHFKSAAVYYDNVEVEKVDGVCYAEDALIRADLEGGESELCAALDKISARVQATAVTGDTLIVYAYSDRVCAAAMTLADGTRYNVMAALTAGHIAIGAPMLSGSY